MGAGGEVVRGRAAAGPDKGERSVTTCAGCFAVERGGELGAPSNPESVRESHNYLSTKQPRFTVLAGAKLDSGIQEETALPTMS